MLVSMSWSNFLAWSIVCVLSSTPIFYCEETNTTVDVCGGCHNGGTCNETIPGCTCPDSYQGIHCQHSVSFKCQNQEDCHNGGVCLADGTCRCVAPYYGVRCEYRDEWWNTELTTYNEERSAIVSITSAMIIMVIICTTIVCMNFKRTRPTVDESETSDVSDVVQVDGPPHINTPFSMEHRDNTCGAQWFLPFQRNRQLYLPQGGAMTGTTTAPAMLQNTCPRKYTLIVSLEDESSGSVVTVPGDSQNSIPPSYEEAIQRRSIDGDQATENVIPWLRNQSSTGICMDTLENPVRKEKRSNSQPQYVSVKRNQVSAYSIPEDTSYVFGNCCDFHISSDAQSSNGTFASLPSVITSPRRSSTDDSLPFIDK